VWFVESIPQGITGKVLRRRLLDAEDGSLAD